MNRSDWKAKEIIVFDQGVHGSGWEIGGDVYEDNSSVSYIAPPINLKIGDKNSLFG